MKSPQIKMLIKNLDYKKKIIIKSENFNSQKLNFKNNDLIIDYNLINSQKNINKYLQQINLSLNNNKYFVGSFKNSEKRKIFFYNKYPFLLRSIFYYSDYVVNRLFPKIFNSCKLKSFFNKDKLLSRAEVYGRLYYNGFEYLDDIKDEKLNYFLFKKINKPNFDSKKYGFLIKLPRIGKNKKKIIVYKLRTMYSYSEYLQDYIYSRNSLKSGGKFKNDFRVSPEGKFFRKFWIDELPMIYNLIKGDLKIVGVRPLSPQYFNLYSEELKKIRVKSKPGLIPPFYYDLPKSFKDIEKSEIRYLKRYFEEPIKTDIIYFLFSIKNILFKGARSS